MKRLSLLLLASLLIICGCGKNNPPPSGAADQVNYMQLAVSAADKLTSEQYSDLRNMFAPELQDTISADELKWAWAQLQIKLGTYQYYASDFSVSDVNNTMIADVPFTFEQETINVKLSFNQKGEINGLYFDSATSNRKISPRLPNDQEILIGSEPWQLSGCLTLPEGQGPFPAVILVQGFGPSDRNEQIGPNLPFYDLAAQLSDRGIAVLRYDKRTYAYANTMLLQTSFTIEEEITDDVAAAYQFLAAQKSIDATQIYIAGHDFSGLIMPQIAANVPDAAGFVLMAVPARTLPDIIDDQAEYIIGLDPSTTEAYKAELLQQAHTLSDNLRTLTSASTLTSEELLGAPVSYWLPLLAYDAPQAFQDLDKPLLFLQGGRDYQATLDDLALWQQYLADRPDVTYRQYSNLNHLFMTGVGKSKPAEYQIKGVVSESPSDDIAAFIGQQHD